MASRYSAWKALERRHAKRMNGVRLWRPDFGESAPDGETDFDVWDAKAYTRFRVHTIFDQCEKKYRQFGRGRRFHLVLYSREQKHVGDLVVLRASDYVDLLRLAGQEGRPDGEVASRHDPYGDRPKRDVD